jgi:hypothetical protein
MGDIVVMFPFDIRVYIISFVHNFNFVNYIIKLNNKLHITYYRNNQSANAT